MELKNPNVDGLYRIDTITDCEVSDVKMVTPILASGELDFARPVRFFSSVMIQMPNGAPFDVKFEITAASLSEACAAWKDHAVAATEKMIERVNAERAKSRLVLPPGTVSPRMQ